MKFNWGTGIFIFYSLFAASLFYQVYRSTLYDHSLVVDNYYEEDLRYQIKFEKKANSLALSDPLKILLDKNSNTIELVFPKAMDGISGKVLFYRPANKKLDVNLPVVLDNENIMRLDAKKFSDGFWKIEVDWKASSKTYFDAKDVTL